MAGENRQGQHQGLQNARKEQETPVWKKHYTQRAGIEGTLSFGVRAFGLRHARYIGLAKTPNQQLLTAAAMNIVRFHHWVTQTPLAQTRVSRFAALQPFAA